MSKKELVAGQPVTIIVAAHKKYQMPNDKMYLPLQVGSDTSKLDLGYAKDNTGQNISAMNAEFCELTGLYWAWKNVNADYLGMVHYRRYFSLAKSGSDRFSSILSSREAEELLSQYKVVLPKKRNYVIETLYSHYAHTHYAEHLDLIREIIEKKYPDYVQDYDLVLKKRSGYMFNMFIMSRSLVNNYCSWVFDILFDMENEIGDEIDQLDDFQKRVYGRISEIAFNAWLEHQIRIGELKNSDIKEVNCIYMEPIDWGRKISSFIMAKFFGQKYSKSF